MGLSVDDVPVAALGADDCEQATCVVEDVELAAGVNTVTAVGMHGAEAVTDTVEWTYDDTGSVNIAAGRLATGYVSSEGLHFGSDEFFEGGRGRSIDPGDVDGCRRQRRDRGHEKLHGRRHGRLRWSSSSCRRKAKRSFRISRSRLRPGRSIQSSPFCDSWPHRCAFGSIARLSMRSGRDSRLISRTKQLFGTLLVSALLCGCGDGRTPPGAVEAPPGSSLPDGAVRPGDSPPTEPAGDLPPPDPSSADEIEALLTIIQPDGNVTSVQPFGERPELFDPSSSAPYGTGAVLLAGAEILRALDAAADAEAAVLLEEAERLVPETLDLSSLCEWTCAW